MTKFRQAFAERVSLMFVVLSAFYCVALVVSNIIAGKLWAAPLGLTLTAGTLLFPIVYIIGDIVPEVYGLRKARHLIAVGFAANLVAVIFYYLTLALPYPPFWQGQAAFETVLGFAPRLLLASFVAYLIGTNANAITFVRVKALTKDKYLWARTISSTIVGESLDSIVFVLVAFHGVLPDDALVPLIVSLASVKIIYEVLATPLTYVVVDFVKENERAGDEVVATERGGRI